MTLSPNVYYSGNGPLLITTDRFCIFTPVSREHQFLGYSDLLPPKTMTYMAKFQKMLEKTHHSLAARDLIQKNAARTFVHHSVLTEYCVTLRLGDTVQPLGFAGFNPIEDPKIAVFSFSGLKTLDFSWQREIVAIILAVTHRIAPPDIAFYFENRDESDEALISSFPHFRLAPSLTKERGVTWHEFPRDTAKPDSCLLDYWPRFKPTR